MAIQEADVKKPRIRLACAMGMIGLAALDLAAILAANDSWGLASGLPVTGAFPCRREPGGFTIDLAANRLTCAFLVCTADTSWT
jgi:hypothetical protein